MTIPLGVCENSQLGKRGVRTQKNVVLDVFLLSFRMNGIPQKKNKWMGFEILVIIFNFGDQMRRMESAIATVQRIDDKPKKMPAVKESPWKVEAIKWEKKLIDRNIYPPWN